METVKLIIDGAAVEEMLRSPNGAVGRYMIGKGEIVRQAAIRFAPKRTGNLSEHIVTRFFEDNPKGFSVQVAALADYSAAVHEGAVPHDIPNAFGYGPTFGIGGRFDGKFHPGIIKSHAQPFLARALPLFVA